MVYPSAQPDSIPWEPDGSGGYRRQAFHLAAWETASHSVHTFRYGGTVHDVLELMLAFEFVESDSGVQAVPRGRQFRLEHDATIRMRLASLGWAEFGAHGNPELPATPRRPGLKTRSGDLYRLRAHHDEAHFAYLLVGTSGVMFITPDEGVTDAQLGHVFENLAFTWSDGLTQQTKTAS